MFAKPILHWFRNQDDQKWPTVMSRALPQSEAMFQSLFHPCTGSQRRPLIFEARKNVLDAYWQLRDTHPAFPEVLRDFQAIKSTTNSSACTLLPLQADIVAAAINAEDGHHILSSLPTGMGKTLPMIVASCLLPPGVLDFFWHEEKWIMPFNASQKSPFVTNNMSRFDYNDNRPAHDDKVATWRWLHQTWPFFSRRRPGEFSPWACSVISSYTCCSPMLD